MLSRFYTTFFLEAYSQARLQFQESLYRAFEAGQLPVPVQPRDRSVMYRKLQAKILQAPPFTDKQTFISVHHCISLLILSLHRILMAETPVRAACEKFESILLTTSGLGRITEFFAAEKGGGSNQRAMRREFMRKMQLDWDAYRNDSKALKVFGGADDHDEGFATPPPVREIWIESAADEMKRREFTSHENNDFVVPWEGAQISIGCRNCAQQVGWQA